MILKKLVIEVLRERCTPMYLEEIWNYAIEKKYNSLINVDRKTPWQTIRVQIYFDIKVKHDSKLILS